MDELRSLHGFATDTFATLSACLDSLEVVPEDDEYDDVAMWGSLIAQGLLFYVFYVFR